MKPHELTTSSYKSKKRLGRGIGSGRGKTATRGTKGQNSRTGGGVKPGFEGGQTKFSMRLPKARGFKARNSINYQIVTTDSLENVKSTNLDASVMAKYRLISTTNKPIKLLLGHNKLTKKVTITVDKSSRTAIKAIEKAGGKVVLLNETSGSTKTSDTKSNLTKPVKEVTKE